MGENFSTEGLKKIDLPENAKIYLIETLSFTNHIISIEEQDTSNILRLFLLNNELSMIVKLDTVQGYLELIRNLDGELTKYFLLNSSSLTPYQRNVLSSIREYLSEAFTSMAVIYTRLLNNSNIEKNLEELEISTSGFLKNFNIKWEE